MKLFTRRRDTHVSAQWLKQQERRDMRITFHSVSWNWQYLIDRYQRWQRRTNRAQGRKAA